MTRDMDLLRKLLLNLELKDEDGRRMYLLEKGNYSLENYEWDQIAYHFNLALQAGLVDQGGRSPLSGLQFKSLTWKGHDFVDSVRDEDIWRRTREGALAAGGFSIELATDLAKGFIRKKVEKLTGIEL